MSKIRGTKQKCRTLLLGVLLTGYLLLTLMDSSAIETLSVKFIQEINLQDTTRRGATQTSQSTQKSDEPVLVDYVADVSKSLGDQIIRMYENVKFHHNGAIIECDSAYLYPDDRAEFFSSVIIQKDSAYIYGDRVLYDGNTNIADVFSPIVKTVQGDAIMYSYNLRFNTKTAVGTFTDGGVLLNKENLMEAINGEFYANDNYVKFLDSVALKNDRYMIKTDSLGFDLKQERLDFLTKTYIWDDERDFLMANKGNYFSSTKTYLFTSDAYMMTPDNEIWADTIRYLSALKQAYMFQDIQILDSANNSIAFGDWAFYDDSIDRAVLSKLPSIMSWERQDTSYMRADTILVLTFEPNMSKLFTPDMEPVASLVAGDSSNSSTPTMLDTMLVNRDSLMGLDSTMQRGNPNLQDSLTKALFGGDLSEIGVSDSIKILQDSLLEVIEPLIVDSILDSGEEILEDTLVTASVIDSITNDKEIIEISEDVLEEPKSEAQIRKELKIAEREAKKEERRLAKEKRAAERQKKWNERLGIVVEADSIAVDSLLADSLAGDSLDIALVGLDSLQLDSLALDSLALDSLAGDSIVLAKERIFLAYNDVRLWAKEYQGKCDSMVNFSVDSTSVMYGDPVLWSKENQITADIIEVYTENSELDWADFIGSPFIVQQLIADDTLYFNQASGARLETFFVGNELDYAYLSGNVQNIYYMTEQQDITALVAIQCANLTIEFLNRVASRMIWEGSGSGPIYPIEQVPDTQTRFLEGFSWQQDIRPKSPKQIMNRRVRESIKHEVEGYVKPVFGINRIMLKTKNSLISEGSWTDRVDVPSVTPQFFIDGQRELLY